MTPKASTIMSALFMLSLLFYVFSLLADGVQGRWSNTSRIVGGHVTDIESFPFLVSIQRFNFHTCGGSIINKVWILTACHCVARPKKKPLTYKDVEGYSVVAGVTSLYDQTPERQETDVKRFLAHPECDVSGHHLYYDVALVEMETPLQYSRRVQQLELWSSTPVMALQKLRVLQRGNVLCFSPGWGRTQQKPPTYSPKLRVALQTMRTANECNTILCHGRKKRKGKCSNLDKIEQMCVTSMTANICSGDSGGPLVCQGYIFGVVSQGSGDCRMPYGSQNYADVRSILKTIKLVEPYPLG